MNKFGLPIDHVPNIRTSKLIVHMNGKEMEGEELFNDKRFLPPMMDPKLYESNSNILFIPTIKLTKEMFSPDMSEEDKRKIFLVESRFETFFQAIRKTGKFPVISSDESKKTGTIESNISFLLKLFFKTNEKFYYNANAYKIVRYDWNEKYFITQTQQQSSVKRVNEEGNIESKKMSERTSKKFNYNVDIDLHLKKGAQTKVSSLDNLKLTCNQRKEEIWNKWDTLMKIGYDNQLKKVNDQINKKNLQKPLAEDVEEREKHSKEIKYLKDKKKSIQEEKENYEESKKKSLQNKKRKSPQPRMLTSRTYYTTAKSIENMNKQNEKNEKKKDPDLPVAVPVVEPIPVKDQDGGKKKTMKKKSGKYHRFIKTLKRVDK
jgi:hypothetical protein